MPATRGERLFATDPWAELDVGIGESLFQFAFQSGLAEEIQEFFAEGRGDALCECFTEAVNANKSLNIGQILRAVTPDAAGNLEFDERLEGGKPESSHISEGVGIRWRVHNGALGRTSVLPGGHHVNIHLVFGLAQAFPKPRPTGHQTLSDKGGMELAQPFG